MVAGRPGPRGLLLRPPALDEAERWIASRPANAPMPTEAAQAFIAASRQAHTRRRNIVSASLAAAHGWRQLPKAACPNVGNVCAALPGQSVSYLRVSVEGHEE